MLSSLTFEQKVKAFEGARDAVNIPEGKLVLVTEEYYDDALELMKYFARDEPINMAVDLKLSPEYAEKLKLIFRDNLSLMIINTDNGEPMALRMNRILRSSDKIDLSVYGDPALKTIDTFLLYCSDQTDFFGQMGAGSEAIHFMSLSVAEKYRNKGLATKIFTAAMEMVKCFDLEQVCIKGEGTSNYSKRIYEKAGFQTLYEINYSDYKVDGEQVFCKTGDHKSMKVYGTTIQKR